MSDEPEFHIEIKVFAQPARAGFAPLAQREFKKIIPLAGTNNATPGYFRQLCEDSLKGFTDEAEIQELELIGGAR